MSWVQDSHTSQHRFDQILKPPLTCRERVKLEYASVLIPYLKTLEKMIGREKVLESLQVYACQGVREFAAEVVKTKGKNDLSVFKEIFSPDNTNLWDVLTVEVVESTEETFKINVKECLLAEVFRKADAAEYGSALLCNDVLFTRLVNPEIELNLEKTLMQGAECCSYTWFYKKQGCPDCGVEQ